MSRGGSGKMLEWGGGVGGGLAFALVEALDGVEGLFEDGALVGFVGGEVVGFRVVTHHLCQLLHVDVLLLAPLLLIHALVSENTHTKNTQIHVLTSAHYTHTQYNNPSFCLGLKCEDSASYLTVFPCSSPQTKVIKSMW